ncbi:GNAT family N-acetyltransferase [Streptomyces similanensis]|uniref:GNAT family N-acetyltransferase n=1 Tax=Streptomyces similanensis TaxID=1274988 RepID=A0ABP9LEV7_9ACTN
MSEPGKAAATVAGPAAWADVETLLGQRGSVKGCWCMFFRQTPQERRTEWGEGNRRALKELVDGGRAPGLVVHRDGEPAGWCSVAPRAEYSRLDRSPVTKPVDDTEVWSLVCLYVHPRHRGAGVARELVRAAVEHARGRGAAVLEAYPVDEALGPVPTDAAYHGLVGLLAAEGFEEVARRTPKRPVMRLRLRPADRDAR